MSYRPSSFSRRKDAEGLDIRVMVEGKVSCSSDEEFCPSDRCYSSATQPSCGSYHTRGCLQLEVPDGAWTLICGPYSRFFSCGFELPSS